MKIHSYVIAMRENLEVWNILSNMKKIGSPDGQQNGVTSVHFQSIQELRTMEVPSDDRMIWPQDIENPKEENVFCAVVSDLGRSQVDINQFESCTI